MYDFKCSCYASRIDKEKKVEERKEVAEDNYSGGARPTQEGGNLD